MTISNNNTSKKTWLLLFIIFLLSICLRYLALLDYKIVFWFDQSRDAYISQQIINNHDLKILGPSASGTNDTIYHGVLYYYFIAPFYILSKGNPLLPALALSILGATGIFPLFFFTKSIFKSAKVSWLSVIFFSFSVEIVQLSHWLSNPSLAVMPLIIFYWSLWESAYQNKNKFLIPLALSLGVCLQSAIWLIYLMGSLLIAIIYNYDHFGKKSLFIKWKKLLLPSFLVILLISTIILGQIMLWKNHVFSLKNLHGNNSQISIANQIVGLSNMYITKVLQSITPSSPIISLVLFIVILLQLTKLNHPQKLFFLSWILAPFWLYIIEWRNSLHMLISLETVLFILLSVALNQLWKDKRPVLKCLMLILVIIFIITNLVQLQKYRNNASSIFSPQQGTDLSMQRELIEYTYKKANGQNFSFSVFSNPYGYFITWAYLYNWYNIEQNKNYLPTYIGPDQNGLFGKELLPRSDVPKNNLHFTIIEPNLGSVPEIIFQKFMQEQDSFGEVIEKQQFGSTLIYMRHVN